MLKRKTPPFRRGSPVGGIGRVLLPASWFYLRHDKLFLIDRNILFNGSDPACEGIPRIDAGSLDGKGDLNSVHSAVIRGIYLLPGIRDHGFGDCNLANHQPARRITIEPLV